MDQRQAVFLKESESPDKNMNALTRRTHLHLLLLPLAVAASLAACGGGDDDGGQVDPPVAPTNLADCFNPSMYTVGSSWTVTEEASGDTNLLFEGAIPGTFTNAPGGVVTTYVQEPPPEWGLPAGTVKLSEFAPDTLVSPDTWKLPNLSGTYVRVHDGSVDQLLTATWYQFSRNFPQLAYRGYAPGLAEPIALGSGQTYKGPPVLRYSTSVGLYFAPDNSRHVAPPSLDGSRDPVADGVTVQLTYVGRETITIPAGTFSTCHTKKLVEGLVTEEWKVAEGPYRGITVQTSLARGDKQALRVTTSVSANWK
ncbi:hypothetical protein [Ottowia oryzae]|uniref:Uncharacterized protein n=1 Tax=Ottowia oryzae TaxID=2109914 RepID=A0A2S0MAN6_9BURK|nr:hypothetical protein [Ottowia oryzae]AVO32880.1 hypothetical protein C6570_00340 [Ottowia oryzae]